jgi:hypothetical protein
MGIKLKSLRNLYNKNLHEFIMIDRQLIASKFLHQESSLFKNKISFQNQK